MELKGEVGKQEYWLANKVPVFERLVKYMTTLQLVLLLIKLKGKKRHMTKTLCNESVKF